jgi:hypothetical protein
MRKYVCLLSLALLAASSAFAAPAKAPKAAPTAVPSSTESDYAFIFDLKNLLLSIGDFEDGYQAGIGMKFWTSDALAIRGLANFKLNTDTFANPVTTTTALGLSGAAEWHPLSRTKVSPYLGGSGGIRLTTLTPGAREDNRIDFYLGGMGGAEIAVWQNLAFYAEYDLIFSFDANGITLDLGGANSAQLGMLIYF